MPAYFSSTFAALGLRPGFTTAFAHEIAIGDFNGDGRLDVTLSYFLYPLEDRAVPIRLLLGDGLGGFTDGTAAMFGGSPPVTVHGRQIVLADFNGDGRSDAFFADHGLDAAPFPGARNALFLSSGASGLINASGGLPNIADFTHSATVGDIDGDGDIDIFVGNQGDGDEYPYFLINDGRGGFAISRTGLPTTLHGPDPGVTTSLLFDADGDGDLDLFLGPWDPRQRAAVILQNDGAGRFLNTLTAIPIPARGTSENVIDSQAVDINGDGRLDLVVTTVLDFTQAGSIRFYINEGGGRFTDQTASILPELSQESWNKRVQFIDVNGDGFKDMLLSNNSTTPLYLNDGAGHFIKMPTGVVPGNEFDQYTAGDFNGDGRTDFLVWRGLFNNTENLRIDLGVDAGLNHVGDAGANGLMGDGDAETLSGLGGADVIFGGGGADRLLGGDGDDYLNGGAGDDTIDGGAGYDTAAFAFSRASATLIYAAGSITVAGTTGRDVLTGVEALSFADGIYDVRSDGLLATQARMTVAGTANADTLVGGESNDILSGAAGNDTLRGGGGTDRLDGGAGFDAALYSGVRCQYTASSTSVSGNGEGIDTLTGVEEARFVDGILTFDAASASAQVMRLYSATLNRTPDQGGLEANVSNLARLGIEGLANLFAASAEFQSRFGALNNQQFVEQMYRFALGREGDAAGIASWVGVMNGGATRGQMVVSFSESLEHQNRTAPTLNAGLWVPDAPAQVIARIYDATFDRLPDPGGLGVWTTNLKGGMALIDIATAFAGSAEFQVRYGAVSNEQFVRQMYQFCLNREPDAAGLAVWVAALNTGTSRAQMLLNFSESAEHVALTAQLWLGGIRVPGFGGAPTMDETYKHMDDPQVLPGELDHDGTYDPAEFGLISLFHKADDAFVLPTIPDGGFQPWIPAVNDDMGPNDIGPDLLKALDAAPPEAEALFHPDIALTLPSDMTQDDLAFGLYKNGHDLAWA